MLFSILFYILILFVKISVAMFRCKLVCLELFVVSSSLHHNQQKLFQCFWWNKNYLDLCICHLKFSVVLIFNFFELWRVHLMLWNMIIKPQLINPTQFPIHLHLEYQSRTEKISLIDKSWTPKLAEPTFLQTQNIWGPKFFWA